MYSDCMFVVFTFVCTAHSQHVLCYKNNTYDFAFVFSGI